MPTIVACKDCGHILHEDDTIPFRDNWYYELFRENSGRCPKCRRPLPQLHKYSLEMGVEVVPYRKGIK